MVGYRRKPKSFTEVLSDAKVDIEDIIEHNSFGRVYAAIYRKTGALLYLGGYYHGTIVRRLTRRF